MLQFPFAKSIIASKRKSSMDTLENKKITEVLNAAEEKHFNTCCDFALGCLELGLKETDDIGIYDLGHYGNDKEETTCYEVFVSEIAGNSILAENWDKKWRKVAKKKLANGFDDQILLPGSHEKVVNELNDAKDNNDDTILTKGEIVEVKLPEWNNAHTGVVQGVHEDGTISVKFEDGDERSNLDRKFIINYVLKKGKAIEARLPSWQQSCRGVVKKLNEDGTIHIKFEDGKEIKYFERKWIHYVSRDNKGQVRYYHEKNVVDTEDHFLLLEWDAFIDNYSNMLKKSKYLKTCIILNDGELPSFDLQDSKVKLISWHDVITKSKDTSKSNKHLKETTTSRLRSLTRIYTPNHFKMLKQVLKAFMKLRNKRQWNFLRRGSAEDNEKSVKTNTVQPPEKTTRRFSVSKERKKKMNAQSFASGYLNFRLIIVDENTGNIIEVYKPYASNLDKDVLNYIKVKDIEKQFVRAIKQLKKSYNIRSHLPSEGKLHIADQLSKTFLIHPKGDPNSPDPWEFGKKEKSLRFWQHRWLKKKYEEQKVASALKITAEEIDDLEQSLTINFYVPLSGATKKVLKGNFLEEHSNMAHDELKLKTKKENVKIVQDKSKSKSKEKNSNMAYDILKLESIQFDPDEKRVNFTGGFLPGESPDDVHLWAIPLIPKNMEDHYALFYGQMSYVSVESAQTAFTCTAVMISLIFHLLDIQVFPLVLCLVYAVAASLVVSLLIECLHYKHMKSMSGKEEKRILTRICKLVPRLSYVGLTALLFLSFCILALLIVYSHESHLIYENGNKVNLKLKAEGCEVILRKSKDYNNRVKLAVFTPYGSALGTKTWKISDEPDENGDIVIKVADTPGYKQLVDDMLSKYGLEEGVAISQNSTESSSSFIAKKLRRRCILQIDIAVINFNKKSDSVEVQQEKVFEIASSLTIEQRDINLYTSRKHIDDTLILNKLSIVGTETVELRIQDAFIASVNIKSKYGLLEFQRTSVNQFQSEIPRLYGSLELKSSNANINYITSENGVICLRSVGNINEISPKNYNIIPPNPILIAGGGAVGVEACGEIL
eukprot:g11836.t1